MKKICFFLPFILLNLVSFSKSIPYTQLERLAITAFQQRTPNSEALFVKDAHFIMEGNDTLIVVFSFSQTGFLVMSADDISTPILAYSTQNNLDMNKPAPGVSYWLDLYKQQIKDAKRDGISATEEIQNQWNSLISKGITQTTTTVVEPLITALWNQDRYYNQLSPADNDSPTGYDNKVPVGCVALAMSMIIYYYRYPAVGQGSHTNYSDYGTFSVNYAQETYDFNAMQDQLDNYNHEVSKLIFHCATSVDMNYAPEGSGAYSQDVPYALKNYFKFANNITLLERSGYTLTNWLTQIKNMLNASKPLFYAGSSTEGGHAFVCDGYDSDDLCHFNFGWGGSGNGFFNVGTTTGSVGGYYSGQRMIINATPSTYPSISNSTTTLTSTSGTIEDGSRINNYTNNLDITYIIAPSNANAFTIQIQNIKSETGIDTLSFWKGNPNQGQLVASYSGNLSNINLNVNTDSLYITFKSNESNTDQGWRLTYTVNTNTTGCSNVQIFTTPTATFSDGTAIYEPYASETDCIFQIRPTNAQNITLTFNRFDLSNEDMVEIYDITTSVRKLIDSYSGSQIPATKTYAMRKLQVNFRTDNKLQKDGFELTYQSNLGMEESTQESFSIYPNPVQNSCIIKMEKEVVNPINGTLYDSYGKQVMNFSIETSETELQLSHLPSGIYLIRINQPNALISKKLIKN